MYDFEHFTNAEGSGFAETVKTIRFKIKKLILVRIADLVFDSDSSVSVFYLCD